MTSPTVKFLKLYSNHRISVVGENTIMELKRKKMKIKIIIDNPITPILTISKDTCAIQLHKKNKPSKMNYLRDGSLKGYKYDIDLVKDPILFICTARKVPHALCDQIKRAGPRKRRYYP